MPRRVPRRREERAHERAVLSDARDGHGVQRRRVRNAVHGQRDDPSRSGHSRAVRGRVQLGVVGDVHGLGDAAVSGRSGGKRSAGPPALGASARCAARARAWSERAQGAGRPRALEASARCAAPTRAAAHEMRNALPDRGDLQEVCERRRHSAQLDGPALRVVGGVVLSMILRCASAVCALIA